MLKNAFAQRPLLSIILLAAFLRLVAACMSPGYLMHDDHFWVIEAAASWADGEDYNNWMPWSQESLERVPKPHYTNLAYAGLHYGFFRLLKFSTLSEPTTIALVIRLLHGLYSLLSVYLAYKITETLSGKKSAMYVGLMMAALAWMPLLSVHQLVEMFVIPPLLASAWVLIKSKEGKYDLKSLILSGIFLGIATGFRYQVGIFGLGYVAAFTLQGGRRNMLLSLKQSSTLALSAMGMFALIQVPADIVLWHQPFAQLGAYIQYNLTQSGDYPQGGPLNFVWVILALSLPPISLLLFAGYLSSFRKYSLLVLPSLAFVIFHSLFPNKQERFILPAVPFVIIAGMMGWGILKEKISWLDTVVVKKLGGILIKATILINITCLAGLTLSSKNTSEMKAMSAIKQRGDLESFLYVTADDKAFAPRFYLGSWDNFTVADATTDIAAQKRSHLQDMNTTVPNYIVFVGNSHLGDLITRFKNEYPSLSYVAQFSPGRLDRLLHYLNPHNPLRRVMVYTVNTQDSEK